jgi:hypothetical protein
MNPGESTALVATRLMIILITSRRMFFEELNGRGGKGTGRD